MSNNKRIKYSSWDFRILRLTKICPFLDAIYSWLDLFAWRHSIFHVKIYIVHLIGRKKFELKVDTITTCKLQCLESRHLWIYYVYVRMPANVYSQWFIALYPLSNSNRVPPTKLKYCWNSPTLSYAMANVCALFV